MMEKLKPCPFCGSDAELRVEWKLDKLLEKEKDIVSRIDLADESGIDQDMMKTLTNDLIEVQKEIKKYGGR